MSPLGSEAELFLIHLWFYTCLIPGLLVDNTTEECSYPFSIEEKRLT